jgi:hypothetical protein
MAEIGKALEVGIPAGLKSCRAYFDAGLGVSIADLAQLIRDVVPAGLGQPIGGQEFAVAPWEKITESQPSLFELACTTAGPPRVAELAQEIVRIGVKRALAGLASEHKFPFASFGDNFLVVDRTELEGYRAISTLIRNYAAHPAPARPLSLGVFGQPGAGKSFGVKQIALNLLGRDRVTFIDSNLSQFSSADDLADVFFSVRDVTLKAGQLPVVFFDEFDSQLPNAPLGWLKYFLAPMQDGKFKYKQTSLGIGKAIFVFAGGTRVRYDDLYKGPLKSAPRPVDKAGAVDGDESERFRRQKAQEYQQFLRTESRHRFSAKVHDFRRRLRGAVDIASINPEPPAAPAPPLTSKPESEPDPLLGEERSPFPDLYLIRRAILFRSMLGASAPHLLDDRGRARVDHGVVEAFLKVPHYEHGAGSMEAIIDMSSLRGSQYFTKAALPPSRLLEMHVQATEFLRCLRG